MELFFFFHSFFSLFLIRHFGRRDRYRMKVVQVLSPETNYLAEKLPNQTFKSMKYLDIHELKKKIMCALRKCLIFHIFHSLRN